MAGDVVTGRAGFDPGGRGAVALLDDEGRLLEVHDMPYVDGHVLAPQLAAVVSVGGVTHALVERAQSMPGQGVASVFRYGPGYGVILGVLGALQVSSELVSPAVWKRAAGLSQAKGASRRRAVELWPAHAALFARVKDDGRAEAALVARHLWLSRRQAVA